MGKTRLNRLTLALAKTFFFNLMLLGNFAQAQVLRAEGEVFSTNISTNMNPVTTGVTLIGEASLPLNTYYQDADQDGFGNAHVTIQDHSMPQGYVVDATDCNDHDPLVQAPQWYFADADHDGFGSGHAVQLCTSSPPKGFSVNGTDCNDGNAEINPDAPEKCNSLASQLERPFALVSPNPGQGKYNLSFQGITGKINLAVYNLQGQLVHESLGLDAVETPSLNLESQPSGLYNVIIMSALQRFDLKLIKQ